MLKTILDDAISDLKSLSPINESEVRSLLEEALRKAGSVSRSEFQLQQDLLNSALERVEILEHQLKELEKTLKN